MNQQIRRGFLITAKKATVCGTSYEFYQYSSVIFLNQKVQIKEEYTLDELVYSMLFLYSNEGLKKRELNAEASARRLRSIIYGNFSKHDKFITLTFRDENNFDIDDLKTCNKRKERYIAKLLAIKSDLKYVVVPEYQKRGAVHYHIICNLPFTPKKKFHDLWVYGISHIRGVADIRKAYTYLSKYISKGFKNPDYYRKRRFYVSNSCNRPKAVYEEAASDLERSVETLGVRPMVEYIAPSPFDTLETTFLERYAAYKLNEPVRNEVKEERTAVATTTRT